MTARLTLLHLGALGFAALALAACGDDDAGIDPCAEPGADVGTPAIRCPEDVVLGCVPAGGAPADFAVEAAVCDGPAPIVTCSTEPGSLVTPGTRTVTCSATTEAGASAICDFELRVTEAGLPSLACAPPVSLTCAGPLTPVEVPEPSVDASCGAVVGAVSSDAPAAGFEPGETLVSFSATSDTGAETRCTTTVTVVDDVPPTLDCPANATVVRTSPDDPATPPPLTASDACDDAPVVTAEPAVLVRGPNDVLYEATDLMDNSVACTGVVEVRDAFAAEGLRIISAALQLDGSTDVTVAWDSGGGADTTGFAIERAAAETGPWTRLATVGRAVRTHTDADFAGPRGHYRVVTLADDLDGGVTAPVLAHAIDDARYDMRGQTVPSIPFPTTLYGVVRYPVDLGEGPYPLVLMLHGNHGICRRTPTSETDACATSRDHECPTAGWVTTPNAEGYVYLLETLAAQGFVTVSISGNAVNCRTTWIGERAQLIGEHLRRWRAWSTGGGGPLGTTFVGSVDMGRVALVGHSRGGEAVAHVPALLSATPIAGVALASVFSLAPTDYDTPVVAGLPYAVLLPGCDGDVRYLFGTDLYDRSAGVLDDHPRAQVLFSGANHNFFNTEWRNDDNGSGVACDVSLEVGAPAQRGMLEGVLGSWLAATTAAAGVEPFMRAEGGVPEGIDAWADTSLDLRWAYLTRRTRIDRFEGPGTPDTNLLGGSNSFTGFETASQCYDNACGTRYPHEKGAEYLRWDGGTPVASIGLSGLDATALGYLSFRVASRRSTFNAGVTEQVFLIRGVDSAGVVAEMSSTDVARIPHLYPNTDPLEILHTVRIPLAAFEAVAPGFDRSDVDRLELEMTTPGSTRGSILVSDFMVGD